jgi:hypothetical protein
MIYYKYEFCKPEQADFFVAYTNSYSDHLTGPVTNRVIEWFDTTDLKQAERLFKVFTQTQRFDPGTILLRAQKAVAVPAYREPPELEPPPIIDDWEYKRW